ncbi:MAG: hypothetical protein MJ238_07435, partial [Bacilli bacterium]|nr:hypothetical protein [Bacilli bacterium]
ALRFGAVLPYSDWTTLTSKTNVTGYGVIAGVASSLTTTIESLYKNSKENISSTKWIEDNNLYHVTLRDNEEDLTLYRCDSTGNVDSPTGDYIKWNLRFDVKSTSYDKEMTAVAYVIVDGEYVFMGERTESVKSLANKYIANDIVTDPVELASLKNLAGVK